MGFVPYRTAPPLPRVVCDDYPMGGFQRSRVEGYDLRSLAVQLIGYGVFLAFIIVAAFFFSSPSNTLTGP